MRQTEEEAVEGEIKLEIMRYIPVNMMRPIKNIQIKISVVVFIFYGPLLVSF